MKAKKIICFLLTTLFIILTVLVLTENTVSFDTKIYDIITYTMSDSLTLFYKIFTFLGSTSFIIGLCICFLLLFLYLKKKHIGFLISGVSAISIVLNSILKMIFRRSRPTALALVTENGFSYPSGHTMIAVSMYGILIYLIFKSSLRREKKIIFSILLGLVPVGVAVSRIYLGVHYVTDVIGAYILSTVLLIIETILLDKYLFAKK